MATQLRRAALPLDTIIYPDSDGKPMADNTQQFRWIQVIYHNLAWLFDPNPEVFVAGDLLWYPVEGDNKIRQAPDVMVVFGVEKGDRGSYQQWKENHIAPQVVFEILSPGNTLTEMSRKQIFYDRYGVEEYYIYDPDRRDLSGWIRREQHLTLLEDLNHWVSPRLGICFQGTTPELQLIRPDGQPFATYTEVSQQLAVTNQQLQAANQQLEATSQQLEATSQQLEAERQRADRLAQRLQELGIDPQSLA
jgi:Uma2 family endonuclease